MRTVDFLSRDGVPQLAPAERNQGQQNRGQRRFETRAKPLVFPDKSGPAKQNIGAPHHVVFAATLVVGARLRYKKDLFAAPPDMGCQIRIGTELAVALVDLADRLNYKGPHHKRCPARIDYREWCGAGNLGRRVFPVGRQVAKLRRRLSVVIYQQWTNRCRVRPLIQYRRQPLDRIRLDLSIFVKE